MAKSKIVVTFAGMSRREKKKANKKLVKKVLKDKKYRRALKESEIKLSRKAVKAVAQATVKSVLKNHEVIETRPTVPELYTEVAVRVAEDCRRATKQDKKAAKTRDKKLIRFWKKRGGKYIPKLGLVKLMKAEKLPKLKKAKTQKPWTPPKTK